MRVLLLTAAALVCLTPSVMAQVQYVDPFGHQSDSEYGSYDSCKAFADQAWKLYGQSANDRCYVHGLELKQIFGSVMPAKTGAKYNEGQQGYFGDPEFGLEWCRANTIGQARAQLKAMATAIDHCNAMKMQHLRVERSDRQIVGRPPGKSSIVGPGLLEGDDNFGRQRPGAAKSGPRAPSTGNGIGPNIAPNP